MRHGMIGWVWSLELPQAWVQESGHQFGGAKKIAEKQRQCHSLCVFLVAWDNKLPFYLSQYEHPDPIKAKRRQ